MTDFIINDHLLQKECDEIAQEIIDEFRRDHFGEGLSDYSDEMSDRAHETADGHEWVIYNYKALMLCAHCDTENGEELLEDIGIPKEPDIYKLATMIAYGEIRARIDQEIRDLLENQDADEEETAENP
jgi:hypothetical protein